MEQAFRWNAPAFYTTGAKTSINTRAWQMEAERAALDKPGSAL